MHLLDPGTIIPNLIVGPIVAIGGVFIVVFRRQLRDWVVSSEAHCRVPQFVRRQGSSAIAAAVGSNQPFRSV
jgi:hypothetical protein